MNTFDHAGWRRAATAEARAVRRDIDRTVAAAAELTGLLGVCGGDLRLLVGAMSLAAEQLRDAAHREMVVGVFEAYTASIGLDSVATFEPLSGRDDPATDEADAPAELAPRPAPPARAYRIAQVARPGGGVALQDMLHTPELDACLVDIVEQEGWLHADIVLDRVCTAFGQARMIGEARDGIVADLARLADTGRLACEGECYAIPDQPVIPRDRSACVPAVKSPRRLPPAEIRAAIAERLTVGPGSRSEVAIAVAAALGLPLAPGRLSSTLLGQAITLALHTLSENQEIRTTDDGMLALRAPEVATGAEDASVPETDDPNLHQPPVAPPAEDPGSQTSSGV